jgi:hypothetical protein
VPKQLSTVTIAELRAQPGRFVLVRTDFPDDRNFLWCGRLYGWMPESDVSTLVQRSFLSQEEAEKAANKYVTWPLPKETDVPGGA